MKSILILALAIVAIHGADPEPAYAKQGDVKLRTNLFKSLMEDYDDGINPDEPNVRFGISLLSTELDGDQNTLNSNVWLRVAWKDSRLTWDTAAFPIDVLRVEFSKLWHPDVTLYNSGELFNPAEHCVQTNALIYPNGEVIWVPPCYIRSWCQNTLKAHPYAEQTCTIKFGSWTYDSYIMDLNFYANETNVDVNDFQDVTEWKIVSTAAAKNTKVYPCCPEPYTDLTFNVTLRRKPESESLCQA